jgi:hypothetical protein
MRACSFLACFAVLAIPGTARAAEGGSTHYAPGSFASFVDVLPSEPGFAAFNYFTYYSGDASGSRQIPIAGEVALNADATYYVESLGGFWITPLEVLGANYAVGAAIPFVWADVEAKVARPGVGSVKRSDSVSGLGDIEFWPVALGWSVLENDLHVDALFGVFAPSGDFQTDRLANQGLGYWTFEPGVLVSYLGQNNGFEFTTYIGADFNTENTETDYTSGNVFHVDATLAQHLPLGKGVIGVGANGFYLQQFTDDRGAGARLGSFKEMTSGVGPVLSYAAQFEKIGFAAEVKWLPQIGAEKTLEGDYVWFKLGVQF